MSLSAAVLFDRALKQTRRAALREQGLVPRPLPQIRIVRWLRAPRETFAAWSLMLLEGVRTLDEAVDEVREDRRQKQQNRMRRRDREKLERAQIRALNRQHRSWGLGRAVRGTQLPALGPATGGSQQPGNSSSSVVEPVIAEPGQLPVRARPSLQAFKPEPVTVDLTAEDDTQALPRLDSLERKLKDLEQQFG
jgi:hypothetical protein